MEIQNEIDKLLTLKESFSKIAGSYSSLVPKEFVTIQLHAENTDLSAYKIKVVNTTSGNEEFYDISASGYTEFEIKYDSVYDIVFPIIGAYITPATRTFTAQKPIRKIEVSYVMAGVFGLDEQGNRYSLNQIEALEDKSIIKYGGYTNEELENYVKSDGTTGCGFFWIIGNEFVNGMWSSKAIEFSQDLLPFCSDHTTALLYCDGESYTTYMMSEGVRLGATTPVATECHSTIIIINEDKKNGFMLSFGQLKRLHANKTQVLHLYELVGATINLDGYIMTSQQISATGMVRMHNGSFYDNNPSRGKNYTNDAFMAFSL